VRHDLQEYALTLQCDSHSQNSNTPQIHIQTTTNKFHAAGTFLRRY